MADKTDPNQTDWMSGISAEQAAAVKRANAQADVKRVQGMADKLNTGYGETWKGYDDDQRTLLEWVQSAGIAFDTQVSGYVASKGNQESAYKLQLAADELGRRWSQYNGLEGYQGSEVGIDENGQPHVRFNIGGVWTTDPGFNGGRGGFDYGKMHDYLKKNGYLGKMDEALAADAVGRMSPPEKSSDPVMDLLSSVNAKNVPPGYRSIAVQRGLAGLVAKKAITQEDADLVLNEMGRNPDFWGGSSETPKKTANNGGMPGEGEQTKTEPSSGTGENTRTQAALADLLGSDGKKQEVPPAKESVGEGEGPVAGSGSTEPSLEDRAQAIFKSRKEKSAAERKTAQEKAQTKTDKAAGIKDEDSDDVKNIKRRAFAMTSEMDGAKFRKINGEYYFYHPRAKVWVAQDGSTWRFDGEQLVSAGGATKNAKRGSVLDGDEPFSPRSVEEMKKGGAEKSADVTFVGNSAERRPTDKVKLEWDEDVLGATGAGGQGDMKKVGTRHVAQDVPEDLKKILADMNRADQDADVNGNADTEVTINGRTVSTNVRQQKNIEAFEESANGAKGYKTLVRRMNRGGALSDGLRARGITTSPAGTDFKAYDKNGNEISAEDYFRAVDEIEQASAKEISESFSKMTDKERDWFFENLNEVGAIELAGAEKYESAKKRIKALSDAWDEMIETRQVAADALGVGLRTRIETISAIKDDGERDRAFNEFLRDLSDDERRSVIKYFEAEADVEAGREALNRLGIKTKKVPRKFETPKKTAATEVPA